MDQGTSERPKIRLLYCKDCRTIESLPDFDGPPEQDTLLEVLMSRHETDGHRHIGKLYDVEERVWELPNLRNTIIDQIKGGSKGLAVFDSSFYDTRDTFKEDAMLCYGMHLRPKEGCSDWRSDRKKLVPPTRQDRKEIGLGMERAPVRYLCDFCPARSYYERKSRGD